MKNILLLALCFCIIASCGIFRKGQKDNNTIVVTYRKTECKGKCPVFFMTIYKNGKVEFEGTKNTDKMGKYSKQLTTEEKDELFMYFEVIDFFSFENEYTASITDLPSTYISYTKNDSTKTIRDYYNAPQEINDLERMLDNIVKSEGWIKIE